MNTFSDWLFSQMQAKGWSQSDLARHAGVTRTAISDVLSGRRKAGNELCTAIALALQIPPEEVFRAAGILKTKSDDPWADKMAYRISQLTGSRRSIAEKLIESLLSEEENDNKADLSAKTAKP